MSSHHGKHQRELISALMFCFYSRIYLSIMVAVMCYYCLLVFHLIYIMQQRKAFLNLWILFCSTLFYSAQFSVCVSVIRSGGPVLRGWRRRRGRSDGAPVHGPPSASCSVFWRRLWRALPTPIDQTFSWMFSSNSRLLQTRGTWRD